jgi:isopenicillin N synthase-like dioxygenase
MSQLQIPVLDFSMFLHGSPSSKQDLADAMLHSFKEIGFVYLTGFDKDIGDSAEKMFEWVSLP